MEVQQVFAPICNVSAINCWCASVCQICQRSVFTHKPRVLQNTLTDTHTPVRSVSTHIWVLLYLLCWRHTHAHARTCIGSLQKHTDFSLMEHFTGKSLARWGEKHTHTLHEYGAKRQNDNRTQTLEALSQTHARMLQLLGARQLSFPTAALNLTETRFHTELFNPVFQQTKKKDGGRVWVGKGKNNSEHISIFGSWWVRRCFHVDAHNPSPMFTPPTTASTVFRVYAAYQGAKLWVCMSKYVFYLKATHCHFKTIHCYCLHFATVSLYIFLKYLCVPPWIDMNEFLYHELLFGPQNIMNFFNILLSLHHISNWSNLAIKTDFVEQNWFLLKLGEIVKIINYFY